jgi:hypothetical protein
LAQIDLVLFLKAADQPVDDARVEVFAAQERIAGRADDFEHAVRADLQDADIEGAAAQVVDGDGAVQILAVTVG